MPRIERIRADLGVLIQIFLSCQKSRFVGQSSQVNFYSTTLIYKEMALTLGAFKVGIATTETLAGGPASADLTYVLPEAKSAICFALALIPPGNGQPGLLRALKFQRKMKLFQLCSFLRCSNCSLNAPH
jgi:hypothetical protein